MGVKEIFDAVRLKMVTYVPALEMELTAEPVNWHAEPPRIVWELALKGEESYERSTQGSGAETSVAHQGILWERHAMVTMHCWIPSEIDERGVEYPDDKEETPWLIGYLINAIDQVTKGSYSLGKAGWVDRSEGNMGWVYLLQVVFKLPVYRIKTDLVATIDSLAMKKVIT